MLKNQGSEFGKIAGRKIFTKSVDAVADKTTSKPEEKIEEEIIIPPDKRQQILMI